MLLPGTFPKRRSTHGDETSAQDDFSLAKKTFAMEELDRFPALDEFRKSKKGLPRKDKNRAPVPLPKKIIPESSQKKLRLCLWKKKTVVAVRLRRQRVFKAPVKKNGWEK